MLGAGGTCYQGWGSRAGLGHCPTLLQQSQCRLQPETSQFKPNPSSFSRAAPPACAAATLAPAALGQPVPVPGQDLGRKVSAERAESLPGPGREPACCVQGYRMGTQEKAIQPCPQLLRNIPATTQQCSAPLAQRIGISLQHRDWQISGSLNSDTHQAADFCLK